MNNNSIGDKTLRVTVHLRDETTKEFSENVYNGSGDNIEMKSLSQKLLSLQTQVNTFLTELVEQERGTTQQANSRNQLDDEEEDDDDDDGDDDDEINEPPVKQQKT